MRTVKTMIAVLISTLLMEYVFHQNPFFACIGAVVAMERTLSSSIQAAITRNLGTITGGLVGIAIGSVTENPLILPLGLIPLIWVSNQLGKQETIVPGAIVYFAVFFLNPMDQAWRYGMVRIFGTMMGSLVAIAVNRFIFPPPKQHGKRPGGEAEPEEAEQEA